MKNMLMLMLLTPLLNACLDIDNCEAVSCIGRPLFAFELIANGENALENGQFNIEDFSLTGENAAFFRLSIEEVMYQGSEVPLLFLSNNNWEPTSYDIELAIDPNFTTQLEIDIALSTGECCSGIPQAVKYAVDGAVQENPNAVFRLEVD